MCQLFLSQVMQIISYDRNPDISVIVTTGLPFGVDGHAPIKL